MVLKQRTVVTLVALASGSAPILIQPPLLSKWSVHLDYRLMANENDRTGNQQQKHGLMMVSSSGPSTSSRSFARTKKTFSDRTREEARDLLRDIIRCTIDAGPQAGFARTFQASLALSSTLRDFLPFRPNGSKVEEFSVPLALRKLFERMGATYVKLGQFIASSPTLFPKEYVVEFQKCLDATEPLPWNVIKGVIENEIGPISYTFKSIEKTPLASASIAQVHAATLKSGEDVVLKVQKPGIDQSLKADLSFVYVASRVIEFLQPDLERTSLSAIAGDIRNSMLEELDFDKEAKNMEEFKQYLANNNLLGQATAPKVFRNMSTKKILTMERLKGVSLLDVESIGQITDDPEAIIINALNIWTTSVMRMPWFHADVHAGNLLVLNDGRVGFIDFGIVGRVSDKTFKAVTELSSALALGNYKGMAQALLNMGATDEKVDVMRFGKDIERVLTKLSQVQPEMIVTSTAGDMQGTIGFDDDDITNVMLDIIDVTDSNGLKLPREFGLLVKQSLYFDRYLKILAPTLDVMGDTRVSIGSSESSGYERQEVEVIIDV